MKYAKIFAVLGIAATSMAASSAPSMAFGLPKINLGKAIKSVGNVVTHPARTVKDAAKTVSKVVSHPERSAKDFGKAYMSVARPVGRAVGNAYDKAAEVSKHISILKPAEPLAREAAKIARSKVGQIGFGVAAGATLVGGGAAALSHIGTSAGTGAVGAYYTKKYGEAAAAKAKRMRGQVAAAVR
ncbi:hypothetical protein SLNSH_04395 [Alsobacter soli]|uniref:Uncharacterized protein n=1 Tax=Alsobacter soli TaxID=2109933 RepID=A0A2T1HWS3_9HYPH|nr:hypothetical protein [Alsobacter soli]PSC06055.1 hypothetical protein SLNSH_04395 [Alsobacter soli]